MSELHVRQIEAALRRQFTGLIDTSDLDSQSSEVRETAFLSRAQGAFVCAYLSGAPVKDVARHVTDGWEDNGLDVVFYHSQERVLYLVQSKWRARGRGAIDRGDVQRFLKGFRDLLNARWERFNNKVGEMADVLESALNDVSTRIVLVIAYTGQEPVAQEIQQDVKDELEEINDTTELVSVQYFRQSDIYAAIAQGVERAPIDIDVALYDWGQVREPYIAYYGQVAASDVAMWYSAHQSRLFAPNIRMFLGPTDVNAGMVETLVTTPQDFWYFNNGITALCRTIAKKPIGGASRETGIFECRDLRIVNGAQTVGAIAQAHSRAPQSVANARVTIRIVALEACPPDFERRVTRYNNTQNRIDRRDFVSLDPEQERLQRELQLEGVRYVYKSGDTTGSASAGFDLTEATAARACRQADSGLAVQAKREIGRLWDDIDGTPYRLLFSQSLNGPTLWRQVLVVRAVEEILSAFRRDSEGRRRLLAVHGNRFIAHLVMQHLPATIVDGQGPLSVAENEQVKQMTHRVYNRLLDLVNEQFPDAYLGSLFKNASKCKVLADGFRDW